MKNYAYVIPFCQIDIDDVVFLLKLWSIDEHKITLNTTYDIDLILYFSGLDETFVEKRFRHHVENYNHIFKDIIYMKCELNKEDDKYPRAPGIMFFNCLEQLQDYKCIFFAEPDCLPIKNNWLKHLMKELDFCYKNNIWIKGSMYRGTDGVKIDIRCLDMKFHLNGNAIYNVGNKKFMEMMQRIKININLDRAYDMEIMRYILNSKEDFPIFFNHIMYSDFMLNYGKRDMSLYIKEIPNETYFVHGKEIIKHFRRKYLL